MGGHQMIIPIFLSVLLWATPASAAGVACADVQADDPAKDVSSVGPDVPDATVDYPPLDLRQMHAQITNESLVIELTVGEKPGARAGEYYRYWLGFDVQSADNKPQYVDLRMVTSTSEDSAEFVGSGEMKNPSLGSYRGVWSAVPNGSMIHFEIPRSDLERFFGPNLRFGQIDAAADGIHRVKSAQVAGAPWLQDFIEPKGDLVGFEACKQVNVRGDLPSSAQRESPQAGFFGVLLSLCVALAVRRHWRR